MNNILGITDGDDAGAALIIDGRLIAAVNEERLNRLKMSIGFPKLAVQEVLRLGGIASDEVTHVAMAAHAEKFNLQSLPNKGWFQEPSIVARIRNEISSALAKPLGRYKIAKKVHYQIKRLTMGNRRSKVRKFLQTLGIDAPISYHEHHRCHAIAAFDASGFENALSISLDGGGDGCSSHIYEAGQNGDRLINRVDSFDSIGNYYAYVTHLCGFRASIHEGKITGLAASGEPKYKQEFERLIDYQNGQIQNRGRLFFNSAISYLHSILPQDWEHKDLAASIQQHLEEVVVKYLRFWLKRSRIRKVCLSGGVFSNVILNQRIADLPECDSVFVFPAMGDGGLSVGAAFSALRETGNFAGPLKSGSSIDHVYLGPSFSDREIEKELRESGAAFLHYDHIEEVVARLVSQGKVVARFNGAMEFGPRALGNRTILYKTDEPEVNTWLNKRLNRTEFMPFAPICLEGHEDKLFEWNPAVEPCAPYMTITQNCKAWMREHCPAVVHVDGTARPQVVYKRTNSGIHRILERFYKMTGVPVLVNTSFNMHEEPIVCTPKDAIRSYRQGQLDNLAIGSFLLGEPPYSED
jgi:carbamoyltransferase